MIDIINEKECCGCSACSVVCPKKCISMEIKTLGHKFPSVNRKLCINCRLCEKVCPMIIMPRETAFEQTAYAAYAKDDNIRWQGSSGGLFGAIATMMISEGYIVYGAAFDEQFKLKCTKAETDIELKKLMKSKYLQSDLSEKYIEIKKFLEKGKKVLFISTPCQIVALKNFLNREYKNLVTIDFFCHGVPSQDFFDRCRYFEEEEKEIKIEDFKFRAKKQRGSTPHYYEMTYKKDGIIKKEINLYFKSRFYLAFQRYINLRESCYNCRFSGKKRNSDITIGDFHEINKYIKGINRFDGVSTVIINTKCGEELFKNCKGNLYFIEVDLKQLEIDKVCFGGGTKRPKNREQFIHDYETKSFKDFSNKWMNPKRYWKQEIYYNLPKIFRDKIKKYIRGV